MKRVLLLGAGAFLVALVVAAPARAASPASVTMSLFGQVVDEQDLNAYYGTTGSCSGLAAAIDVAGLAGDSATGPSSAYDVGSPWTPVEGLTSAAYADGADCNPATRVCLGVKFNHNRKTLSLDTRGTAGPRTLTLDFGNPCLTCGLAGNPGVFGSSLLATPALISFFADSPFTNMALCSSTACTETQAAFAKMWFADPAGQANVNWEVDWAYLRALRVANGAWYLIGDGCDGSQVASLWRIHKRTRQLVGYYLMPFFLSASQ